MIKVVLPGSRFFLTLVLGFTWILVYGKAGASTKFSINSSIDSIKGKNHIIRPLIRVHDGNDISLVHENRLDKIVLGNSLKDIFSLYPSSRIQRVLIYDAHRSYQKIEVLSKDKTEVLFSIDPDCSPNDSACVVRRINIKSSTYHTPIGLRVGKYYVDIMHTATKVTEVKWYEGNLIARTKQSGISYVLQTNLIPRPWYSTMDKETVPDSTKIIGIMITGKNLDGFTYQLADSLNKKRILASITKRKSTKKLVLKKGVEQSLSDDIDKNLENSKIKSLRKTDHKNAVKTASDTDQSNLNIETNSANAGLGKVETSKPVKISQEANSDKAAQESANKGSPVKPSEEGILLESSPEGSKSTLKDKGKVEASDLK